MNYIEHLQSLSNVEVSLFLKEKSQDENFLSQLKQDKESFIRLLLSKKVYPAIVLSSLIENNKDLAKFLSICIEESFTPSIEMIESLSQEAGYEALISDVLVKFPTIPLTPQVLMRFINRDLEEVVVKILEAFPSLRKPEVYDLMIGRGFDSNEFVALYFSEDRNKLMYLELLDDTYEMDEFIYPANFSNYYVYKFGPPKELVEKLLSLKNYLNPQEFLKCLTKFIETMKKDKFSSLLEKPINWNDEIENLPEKMVSDLRFTFVPTSSKYRSKFITYSPESASDEEIIILIDKKRSFIYATALSRSMEIIQRLDLNLLQEKISPSKLVELVSRESDSKIKLQYFYKNLPSKYADYIYKHIDIEDAPDRKKGNKRSYYLELFEAIKKRNLGSFRENLNYGYSLEQFHKDSKQSSKKRNCEILSSLEWGFLNKLTKDEVLCLCQTPIPFQSPDSNATFPFKFDEDESYILFEKFSADFVFNNVEDQEKFILSNNMDKDQLSNLFNSHYSKIIQNPNLIKAFLFVWIDGEVRVEMDGKSVSSLSDHLTSEELKRMVKIDNDRFEDYLGIKGSDGEFFISFEDIKKYLSKNRQNLEEEKVLVALSRRNPEYYSKLVSAYLGGNKELSEFFGAEVKIKRMKKDLFTRLSQESIKNPEQEVERIFSEGGALENFSQSFFDWEIILQKYGKNRKVIVPAALISELKRYIKISGVVFNIENLIIGHDQEGFDEDEFNFVLSQELSNVTIENVIIENAACTEEFLKNMLPTLCIKLAVDAKFSETLSAKSKIQVILAGNNQFDSQQVFNDIIEEDSIESLGLKEIQFMDSHGLGFSLSLVERIVQSNMENEELLQWLKNRVGDLDSVVINSDSIFEEGSRQILEKIGVKVLSEEDFWMFKTKEKLLLEGSSFSPIMVDRLSFEEVSELIKFIGDNIDSNYHKIDFETTNSLELDVLAPYKFMVNALSYKDEELVKNFLIPPNLQTKKILKSLRDLVSLKGLGLTYKVLSIQEFISQLGGTGDLSILDFMDLSNPGSIEESENLQQIDNETVQFSLSNIKEISGKLLVGQSKTNILRFLRTATEKEISYVKDIFGMFNTVVSGIASLEERLKVLMVYEDQNEEEILKIKDSIFSLKKRLEEISTIDHAVHIHDRLVPMAALVSTNPTQPLGQDKFNGIEFSEEVVADLGYALYFPKVRSDLQYLGDHNHWCVNSAKSYGDDVIKKNNILVGICEKNTPPSKENVIALAHFIHKGNKKYSLEQLKWSSRKKGGAKNVDATSSFNYRKIISIIENYLQKSV